MKKSLKTYRDNAGAYSDNANKYLIRLALYSGMAVLSIACAGDAFAQSTGGDPTAAFTTKITQLETVSSAIIAGILGLIDLWVLAYGAIKGQLMWPWLILLTIVAIIAATYTVWKPLLVGV